MAVWDKVDHTGRVLGTIDKFKVVSLFPYQIKDRGRFLFQDHPVHEPADPHNQAYWQEEVRRALTGLWVEEDGQWVYMMPKLYFYINHLKIPLSVETDESTDRVVASPRLGMSEWVLQSLQFACIGFSGFVGDDRFTCNRTVRRIHLEDDTVSKKEVDRAAKYCKNPKGDWKEYVDPWEYLTRFYLCDNPAKTPLGNPLYQNEALNSTIVTCRESHKTYNAAADMVHEFVMNGARTVERWEEANEIHIFAGANDSNYLGTLMGLAEGMYMSLAGSEDGETPPSPFFREVVGSWGPDRDPVEQKYQLEGERGWRGSKSWISKGIFVGKNKFASVSKRQNLAIVDESGRIPDMPEIEGNMKNTLIADGKKFGRLVIQGTGGNIESVIGAEEIFKNPRNYSCIEIPDYQHNPGQMQGLFISFAQTLMMYTDEQGNTDMLEATKELVRRREALDTTTDAGQERLMWTVMNESIDSREPFSSSAINIFPQQRIADRIQAVEDWEWDDYATPVDIQLTKGGQVSVEERPQWMHKVIRGPQGPKEGEQGCVVVYEPPVFDKIPEQIDYYGTQYKIVYDPVSDKAEGPSFAAAYVYKALPSFAGASELYDTFVAAFIGRRADPDDEHMIVLCLSIWYHAPIFYESNISGIPAFFDRYGQGHRLMPAPLRIIKDLSEYSKQREEPGVTMTAMLKLHTTRYVNAWVRERVSVDRAGNATWRVDLCLDLRFLYEMVHYGDGNYDAISAIRLLMLWLKAEEKWMVDYPEDEDENEELKELEQVASSIVHGDYF